MAMAFVASLAVLERLEPARAEDDGPRAYCPGSEVPVDLKVAWAPYVYMRFGEHAGAFLIDTGTEHSEVDKALYGLAANARTAIAGSSFPTISGGRSIWAADLSHISAPTPLAGIIGTDYLGTRTFEFHYEATYPYVVVSQVACPANLLRARGFGAIDQTGYFGNAEKAHLSTNMPVVYLRLGSVSARAWIDTGFKEFNTDPPPGVVEVDDVLLDRLRKAGVAMHPDGSFNSTVCDGQKFKEDLLQVETERMRLTDASGTTVFWEGPPPVLDLVKTHKCKTSDAVSGFGDLDEPLAMIGAIYLKWWGVTIFDPLNHAVWIKPKGHREP